MKEYLQISPARKYVSNSTVILAAAIIQAIAIQLNHLLVLDYEPRKKQGSTACGRGSASTTPIERTFTQQTATCNQAITTRITNWKRIPWPCLLVCSYPQTDPTQPNSTPHNKSPAPLAPRNFPARFMRSPRHVHIPGRKKSIMSSGGGGVRTQCCGLRSPISTPCREAPSAQSVQTTPATQPAGAVRFKPKPYYPAGSPETILGRPPCHKQKAACRPLRASPVGWRLQCRPLGARSQ